MPPKLGEPSYSYEIAQGSAVFYTPVYYCVFYWFYLRPLPRAVQPIIKTGKLISCPRSISKPLILKIIMGEHGKIYCKKT